jgi:threonine/homoserine/homoserine lactone efflux protein
MTLDRAAVAHCQHVWALLLVAFLCDLLMLWIVYRTLKPGWLRALAFMFGVCFALALPFLTMIFGCGAI